MIRKIRKKFALLFVLTDTVLIFVAINAAPFIRFQKFDPFYYSYTDYQIYVIFIFFYTIFFIFDFYDITVRVTLYRFFINYFFAFIIISMSMASLFYLVSDSRFGRGIWLLQLFVAFILLGISRIPFIKYYQNRLPKKKFLIIGHYSGKEDIIALMHQYDHIQYFGTLLQGESDPSIKKRLNILGSVKDLDSVVQHNGIDAILITDKSKINRNLERNILKWKMSGVVIYDIPSLIEALAIKVPVDSINDYWIIFNSFSGINQNLYNLRIKRVIDVVIAFSSLLFLSPFMMCIALIIKCGSQGPVFYKQTRIGKDEKEFLIVKYRSMRQDAEKNGAIWASKRDARITRFGLFIRKFRIDELPQLWNVLRGDMTIVGPRPERPEFVDMLKKEIPYYSLRHMIKPGISGWAQIHYPYGASVEEAKEKLKYDLYYMRRLSLKIDIIIMLKTIRTILLGQGSR